MAWQNVVSGYKVVKLSVEDIIPKDAIFLYSDREFVGMFGFVSNLRPHYETALYFKVPVYKKKNIKKA